MLLNPFWIMLALWSELKDHLGLKQPISLCFPLLVIDCSYIEGIFLHHFLPAYKQPTADLHLGDGNNMIHLLIWTKSCGWKYYIRPRWINNHEINYWSVWFFDDILQSLCESNIGRWKMYQNPFVTHLKRHKLGLYIIKCRDDATTLNLLSISYFIYNEK